MIVIEIAGVQAQIERGQWACEDKQIGEIVDTASAIVSLRKGYEPYRDLTTARLVAEMLGGEVVQADMPSEGPSDRIY